MIGQVSIRIRACRTGATGDRRRWRSLEKAIHAGARNTPRARDPRQAITTRRGRRDRLAHRLDLLRAKGLLASMAAILADSNSLSMVISPTLDFSRAISSSRSSRSRSFRADAALASARSRHSVSLATETFASLATTSNGSPRNKIPWGVDSGRLWEQTEVVNPLNPWRRPMSLDHRCEEPTAIRSNVGAIFVSLELSRSTWLITSLSPGSGEKMSKYGILAGDLAALLARFSGLKQKAFARTGKSFSIVVIQEAGLDGFWIHRVLQSEGIESYVVDPASIATSRRRRRAKTDRIDGEALVRALLAYKRGEPRVCAIVSAPTPEDEDNRRLCRERKALTAERIQHVNRIKGLLFSQGVSDYEPLRRNRRQRLDELKTGDSRPLPMHLKAQIGRELDRLELLLEQIKAVEAERDALLASAKPTEETSALPAMLVGLKGIGPEFAAVLWSEGLYRIFANRKQVAAYAGLAPTPWQSGTVAHEQGVSKAGNPRLRTTMIQLAWLSQGVSDYEPLRRNRRQRLDELKTGDSRPLPLHLKAQIGRELDRLELLLEQIKAVEAERDALLASAKPTEETSALPAMLVGLKGIGPEFAAVLWSEGLYRIFANRKQVAAYAGLAPTPWQSGTVAHEQGVSKAGNPRLRTTMIQLAWLWLRHQPHSALAQWFKERVKRNGGRLRKTTIVALARKLLVALWKYVNAGVVIEGAVMKVSS